jgi:hypothetical protein
MTFLNDDFVSNELWDELHVAKMFYNWKVTHVQKYKIIENGEM